MFQPTNRKPNNNFTKRFRGGQHENEIDRVWFGSLIVRVLAFPNGKRRVEQLHFGEWEKVTPAIAREICFMNFRAENWFRDNTELLNEKS